MININNYISKKRSNSITLLLGILAIVFISIYVFSYMRLFMIPQEIQGLPYALTLICSILGIGFYFFSERTNIKSTIGVILCSIVPIGTIIVMILFFMFVIWYMSIGSPPL